MSVSLTDEGWVPVIEGSPTFVHRGPEDSVWVSDGSSTVRVPRDLLLPLAKTLIAERVYGARRAAG